MEENEIFLGEASIIECLLFGGERKAKLLEKILLNCKRHVNDFKESFNPAIGIWRGRN